MARQFQQELLATTPVYGVELKALRALAACRTPAMGGHHYRCDTCPYGRIVYNSCRSRYCPICNLEKTGAWIEAQKKDLLPVPYRHGIFKLPSVLSGLALANRRVVYNSLFHAAWAAVKRHQRSHGLRGATVSVMSVLHTWGQQLPYRPHSHLLVSCGGLSKDGTKWLEADENFLNADQLEPLFLDELSQRLRDAYQEGALRFHGNLAPLADPASFALLLKQVLAGSDIVHSSERLQDPERIINYLAPGRGVPLSNARILEVTDSHVTLAYRANDDAEGLERTITLTGPELLRRVLLHVLPLGLMRTRHYGLLGNRARQSKLKAAKEILGVAERPDAQDDRDPLLEQHAKPNSAAKPDTDKDQPPRCPACTVGRLSIVEAIDRVPLAFPKARSFFPIMAPTRVYAIKQPNRRTVPPAQPPGLAISRTALPPTPV